MILSYASAFNLDESKNVSFDRVKLDVFQVMMSGFLRLGKNVGKEFSACQHLLLLQICFQKASPGLKMYDTFPKDENLFDYGWDVDFDSPYVVYLVKQAHVLTCLKLKSFENTLGKSEIAHNHQFLLF